MSKYDEALDIICHASRVKMALNSHKGAIESLDTEKCIELLKEELEELGEASYLGDHEKVIVEAGDAINFLVAIVYRHIREYRERK